MRWITYMNIYDSLRYYSSFNLLEYDAFDYYRCVGSYEIYLSDIIKFYNWVMTGASNNKGQGKLSDSLRFD
ncbi:hypothetical protein Syun_028091 [Stephania yunnanensis]|uniref:Uncharacterized protein n=1 Tax=Stephania yunnanensis TaxID=152371 RepID=A0AAP0HRU5_9MAGN